MSRSYNNDMCESGEDDDEMILVFPSSSARVERHTHEVAMSNITNSSPPIRPRHVPSRIGCHTSQHQFRLSPCRSSPSIWSMIHQQISFGGGPVAPGSRSYNTPPVSQATIVGGRLYRPSTIGSSIHGSDYSNHNNIIRSPERTTRTIPCVPVIESPVEDDTICYHHTRNDFQNVLQQGSMDENRSNHHDLHPAAEGGRMLMDTEASMTQTTTNSSMRQLPITTATVAASLRMRKQQSPQFPTQWRKVLPE